MIGIGILTLTAVLAPVAPGADPGTMTNDASASNEAVPSPALLVARTKSPTLCRGGTPGRWRRWSRVWSPVRKEAPSAADLLDSIPVESPYFVLCRSLDSRGTELENFGIVPADVADATGPPGQPAMHNLAILFGDAVPKDLEAALRTIAASKQAASVPIALAGLALEEAGWVIVLASRSVPNLLESLAAEWDGDSYVIGSAERTLFASMGPGVLYIAASREALGMVERSKTSVASAMSAEARVEVSESLTFATIRPWTFADEIAGLLESETANEQVAWEARVFMSFLRKLYSVDVRVGVDRDVLNVVYRVRFRESPFVVTPRRPDPSDSLAGAMPSKEYSLVWVDRGHDIRLDPAKLIDLDGLRAVALDAKQKEWVRRVESGIEEWVRTNGGTTGSSEQFGACTTLRVAREVIGRVSVEDSRKAILDIYQEAQRDPSAPLLRELLEHACLNVPTNIRVGQMEARLIGTHEVHEYLLDLTSSPANEAKQFGSYYGQRVQLVALEGAIGFALGGVGDPVVHLWRSEGSLGAADEFVRALRSAPADAAHVILIKPSRFVKDVIEALPIALTNYVGPIALALLPALPTIHPPEKPVAPMVVSLRWDDRECSLHFALHAETARELARIGKEFEAWAKRLEKGFGPTADQPVLGDSPR